MTQKILKIRGMHCASCASVIEKTLKKVPGVNSAEANYGTETAKIDFDESKTSPKDLSENIKKYGYSFIFSNANKESGLTASEMGMSEDEHTEHLGFHQSKSEKLIEISSMKKRLIFVAPIALLTSMFMIWDILARFVSVLEMPERIFQIALYALPIFAVLTFIALGKPYLLGVYRFLRYGKANMDTLVGIGTSVAFLYSVTVNIFSVKLTNFIDTGNTYYDVAIIVLVFIALGKYLEARSKLKTGDAIEKLLGLQAKTAFVIRNGNQIEIPITEVIHGDEVVVRPGGKIPVDGIITQGSTFIDESMVSGEPMPEKRTVGDSVVAGTINTTGSFTFKATKIGSETLLANIIRMVEEAQGTKAPIQALADKISAVFVPIVIVISFISLLSWMWFGTGELGFSQALSFGLVSFVGVLVIACPCALGLATPTAIIVGVGKGARNGILVKDAATLEKLHKVNTVVVDKTGTITKGKPTLVDIENFSGESDENFLSVIASLENKSEHPIAHALVQYSKGKNIKINDATNFENIEGKGIKGIVNGFEYFVGNSKLVTDLGLHFDISRIEKYTVQGKTPVLIMNKEKVLGFVMVADELKPESKQAVSDLHKLGIKVIMLTGDDKETAKYIADQVGIDEIFAHVMPQDKLLRIKELQEKGRIVAMAGDGVNDAPALAQADVGIAMATGTDVAIESAGITLLHGDISRLVKAVRLSKLTMRGIKQNLFWAFIYNIVGIPLASGIFYPIFGWLLNPVFAGLAMGLSSVSVVGNSLRLKTKKI